MWPRAAENAMSRRVWIGILVVVATGCSSRPKDPDPMAFDEPPPDFALAATVYAPPASPGAALPARPLRPARYVLDPDLVLHAAIGAGADEATFPAQTRRLRHRDVERLWRLVRDSGLLEPGSPQRLAAAETYAPSADRTTAVLTVSYAGVRRSYRVLLDEGGDSGPGREVVDELAELAWVGG
jgi:hypothetical protein